MKVSTVNKFALKAFDQFSGAITYSLNELGINVDSDGALVITDVVIADLKISHRVALVERAQRMGFARLLEYATYTWFNRFCAIRYMELHDYLGHGLRLFSHPDNPQGFEILENAQDIAAEFKLERDVIIELKLAGDKDEELYQALLLAQCRQLHDAMPFLFGAEDDELELLLPSNLTRTDSSIRLLVDELPESYWQSLDLFPLIFESFYSHYKKTLSKKVGRAELPIVTQICEPKWISQFMVENTLARRWKELSPDSTIDKELLYYLAPVEQPELVTEHVAKISDGVSTNPEVLRILEPACGSGSNLLQAYELLYKIYQEQGYRSRDIPQTIFKNNLAGLDIDERAIQVTSLVLMLRAREDDRRIFTRGVVPSIFNLSSAQLSSTLDEAVYQSDEVGYLLTLPENTNPGDDMPNDGLASIVDAETALKSKYDVVISFPPNMGILGSGESLSVMKQLAISCYPSTKSNLATMIAERSLASLKPDGFASFILKDSWLFMARYEKMRDAVYQSNSIECLAHFGRGVIPDHHRMNAVVLRNAVLPDYNAQFCLTEKGHLIDENSDGQKQLPTPKTFPIENDRLSTNTLDRMGVVPTMPVSYWLPLELQNAFLLGKPFSKVVDTEKSVKNINRDEFVRLWSELDFSRCRFDLNIGQPDVWVPLVTGGSFRRWYGNLNNCVNSSTIDIKQVVTVDANSWTALTPTFNTRTVPPGSYFDSSGPCFGKKADNETRQFLLGLTNSKVFDELVKAIYPEGVLGSIRTKDLAQIPIVDTHKSEIALIVDKLVPLAEQDWHKVETSWGFTTTPWLDESFAFQSNLLAERYLSIEEKSRAVLQEVGDLESALNDLLIKDYHVDSVMTATVPKEELAFHQNPYFQAERESGLTDNEYHQFIWDSYKTSNVEALISYGVGCIMGRYCAEKSGIHFAGSSKDNSSQEIQLNNLKFTPDADGIVPLMDTAWFEDDIAEQFRDWVKLTFGSDALDNNLLFIAESLSAGEVGVSFDGNTLDTLRDYLVKHFYKAHLNAYQRRPVYWLFSSGKKKAFECLVYLHRYNESSLARMRVEYVTPLLRKYAVYIEQLENKIENETSSVESNRFKRELMTLKLKLLELQEFDAKLKHYADRRISLDLDDGVKINYAKFGDLLTEVKTITGKAPERI
ncbi:MAG: BREX-1 system adenine-specific DNA-methyltransferase PglX [Candidatus Reddybacter sp.]